MGSSGPSDAQKGDRHYGTAHMVLFPAGKGLGSITPRQNVTGAQGSPAQPTHRDLFGYSVLPPRVFLPPAVGRVRTHTFPALLHPQHRLGLNFWPQSLHGAGKQAETQWDSRRGGVWQRPGPGTGLTWPSMQDKHLPTCALPQMNERQKSEYRPIFLLTSVSPAGHPHTAGPRLAPSWGGDVAWSWFCFPTYPRLLLSRTMVGREERRGRSWALLEHPSHSRTGLSEQDHYPEHRGTASSAPSACPQNIITLQ